MAEPPVQTNSEDSRDSDNPFAPAHIAEESYPIRTELNGLFWVTLSAIFLLSIGTAVFGGFVFGVASFVTTIFAAVRTVLVQRALSGRNYHVLPDATYLLILSWVITAVLFIATLITFAVICIPIGFTIGEVVATAIAGSVALLMFAGLYYASLKLPF